MYRSARMPSRRKFTQGNCKREYGVFLPLTLAERNRLESLRRWFGGRDPDRIIRTAIRLLALRYAERLKRPRGISRPSRVKDIRHKWLQELD